MKGELMDKQIKVLAVVMRSWQKRGKPPQDQEIIDRTDVGDLKYHIGKLQAMGYLSRDGCRRVLKDHNGNTVRMVCTFQPIEQGVLQITDHQSVK